jgi:fructose-1,6-bisphosphatase/inositol monophosphatase family enzyme
MAAPVFQLRLPPLFLVGQMRFTRQQLAVLDSILRDAASREIMPRFRRLSGSDVRHKTSATDLVTEADEAAERLIGAELSRAFRGCLVVGEEGVSADPAILEAMREAELAIVVDPIDGTLNYASGAPLFCTMAAVIIRGETVGAVIHDPVTGSSHMAMTSEGAWCEEADGRRFSLHAASAKPLHEMSGMASWRYFPEPWRSTISRHYPMVSEAASLRCCGHEYRLLASGACDFVVHGQLMPWDHAPGLLIHREAGGYSAQLDGLPYEPATRRLGIIAAPDRASWETLRSAFIEGRPAAS